MEKKINKKEWIWQKINCKRSGVIIAFLVIGVGLLMQHGLIGMYFDDFGNASLSYSYDSSKIQGTNYTIDDLLAWAQFIYYNWGGRIVYALMLIPMLKNNADLFMATQAIILLLIFVLAYKIVKRYCGYKEEPFVVVGLFAMYGLLNATILTWGVYWASASVLYVWPVLPFLLFIYLYDETVELYEKNQLIPDKNYIYFLILIPLITLSQEQIGGAFLVWFVCKVGCRLIERKIKEEEKLLYLDIYIAVWGAITFGIFLAAPGNWTRLDSSVDFANLSVFEKIELNIPILIKLLTDRSLYGINVLLWMAGFAILIMMYKKKKNKTQVVLLAGIIPFGLNLCNIFTANVLGISIFGETYGQLSFGLFIISMFFILTFFFYEREKLDFMAIMISAVASVVCLLISPSLNLRSCIPYVFSCMMMIAIAGYTFWMECNTRMIRNVCRSIGVAVVLISVINLGTVYVGYAKNSYADNYNFEKLQSYNGIDTEIVLMKYQNDTYRAPMPCDAGYEYCEYWMKEYFDIPFDVMFVWEE